LSRLVDGLLALARAEREGPTSAARAIQLDQLLADRAEAWQPIAAERGVTITADGNGHSVLATSDRLIQVLDNLMANALQASPTSGSIALSGQGSATPLGGRAPAVEIHVRDDGPGMTEDQRRRAFDRFWRARSTRSELGSSGLGLAIVQKLVQADGGEVELGDASSGGLDVTVRMPRA
jgi:signal transduction histidine kinase